MSIVLPPHTFWRSNIPFPLTGGWVEDSSPVSDVVRLSRREVLGLVLLAHVAAEASGLPWMVGFDPDVGEPNDGFVALADRSVQIDVESKMVPQHEKDTLGGLLNRVKEVEARGESYGRGRSLVLLPNRHPDESGRAVKISDVGDRIRDLGGLSFDRVFLVAAISESADSRVVVFHVYEEYPRPNPPMASELRFDLATGSTRGVHVRGIEFL